MKILVVSNLYPPHFFGGYELGCRDVVNALQERGHDVRVLTGDYKNSETSTEGELNIRRTLRYSIHGSSSMRGSYAECCRFSSELDQFSPDLVYFWNQSGLSRWLPMAARWAGYRMAFFISDSAFLSWRVGAWLNEVSQRKPWLRSLLGKSFLVRGVSVLRNQPCHFASEFLQKKAIDSDAGLDLQKSVVAHWGINPVEFPPAKTPRANRPIRRLLYVGQISPIKGIHTAISALAELAKQGFGDLRLSIVGSGLDSNYGNELLAQAQKLGLSERVEFRGKIPRSMLAAVYQEHDLLIFPSEWDEPFAIVPLEAMASGLAVVGTTTGGSGELFRNHETAFTFRAGDPRDCARAIAEACQNQTLFETVRLQGQQEVLRNFTLAKMIDILEPALKALVR